MSADAPLSGLTLNPASAAVAFAAGVVSLLSPCVLALVPAYLGYLSASAAPEAAHSRPASLLGRALWFVAGFSVFFVALGASATALGQLLWLNQPVLRRLAGTAVVALGLRQLGLLRFGQWLDRERRLIQRLSPDGGWRARPWGAALVGMAFAAGWSPCIGPVLASILMLAGTAQTVGTGMALLGLYAAGMALPFVAMAAAVGRGTRRLGPRLARYGVWAERAGGVLLLVIGVMLYTNFFVRLPAYFNYYRGLLL